jgi:hypothetical protein
MDIHEIREATMEDCQKCNEPPNCSTKPHPCNIEVQDEVIREGDVVNKTWCEVSQPEHPCVIIASDENGCAVQHTSEVSCVCNATPSDLSLIRKGPKKRVFEGVRVGAYIEGGFGSGNEAVVDYLKNEGKGKTFRLVFEEMEPTG